MSMFHSTVSRRDFMKFMGTASATLGAATALVQPLFHDIDELASSSIGPLKRPWYVKERDFYNPTTEIDWTVMKRRSPFHTAQESTMRKLYYGDRETNASGLGTTLKNGRVTNNDPGFTYRSRALRGSITKQWPSYVAMGWEGPTVNVSWTKGGGAAYTGVQDPTARNEPKWTGTEDEGAKILAAFMRYMGSGVTGFGALDQKIRSQVISTSRDNSSTVNQVFEDVDKGYSVANVKQVIPNKNMWFVSTFEPGDTELSRAVPNTGQLGMSNYTHLTLWPSTWNFVKYLGYQMLGDGGDNGTPFVEGCAAMLTGVGEMSRQELYTLTPEFSCAGRLHNFLTDLPITPTKPIDSGIFKFCHTCHKCADQCPPGAISQAKEPSWDLPNINGVPTQCHNTGTKEFWQDGCLCSIYCTETDSCHICYGNCTFTVNNGNMIHQLVKSTVANTSLLNGFFWKMGEDFHYGADVNKAETWWDLSLPCMGFDSTICAFDGGYRK